MRNLKLFCCPDCRFRATKLSKVNRHIGQTKCNNGNKISKLSIMINAEIIESDAFEINLQKTCLAT